MPCCSVAARNVVTTSSPVTGSWAVQESRYREWSSSQFRISTSVPSARRQWVKSDCQVSFGCAASNRTYEDRGRFRGSGVTSPAASGSGGSWRSTGAGKPSRCRCQRDGHRAGIQTVGDQLTRSSHDPCRRTSGGVDSRVALRSTRSRIDRVQPAIPVASEQPVQMPTREPVLGSAASVDGELLGDDLQHHEHDASTCPATVTYDARDLRRRSRVG